MNLKIIATVLAILLTTACTDALFGKVTRFNNEADIQCFSGSATPVFTDQSTGQVEAGKSGVIYYKSKRTGKFVQLYMDCVITETD